MKTIFFIGYMGSGKSTLGRWLATALNLRFIDLDEYIETSYTKSVGELFDEVGETEFRNIERKALREVAKFEDCLIATGGGTPCFFDNMDFMNAVGVTVYLRTSVAELTERLKLFRNKRPLLRQKTDEELETHIVDMLEKRAPFYQQAHFILDTETLTEENLLSRYQALF